MYMYLEILVYENRHEAYCDNIIKIICNSPPIARLGPLPQLLALRCPSDSFEVFPKCDYLSVAYKPPARQKFLTQVLAKRVVQTSQLLDPILQQKKENSYTSMLLILLNKPVLAALL